MPDSSSADPVTEAFMAQRDRLHGVAYRMLGSHTDAEDVVQEAWLRLSRQDPATIQNLAGWLTTVVGRISLDVLRSRRTHPEAPYDAELPELVATSGPVATSRLAATSGLVVAPVPEEDAALADSIGLALLVVLESLGPSERLAFVLHDLFAVPFDEIAQILGKSPGATKMLASRARRKVQTTTPPSGTAREQRELVNAFLTAARHGDFEALLRVLDPNVRLTIDTPKGKVILLGATKVATGTHARMSTNTPAPGRHVLVNNLPGYLTWQENGNPLSLLAFTITHNHITEITAIANPTTLASLSLPSPP